MSDRQDRASRPYDRLPDAVTEFFGEEATAESAYDLLTVDVPATEWITALRTARDELGCSYFDWLSAVDEPGTGFRVCAHVAALGGGTVRRIMLRTTVPHDAAVLPSAIDVYAGAAWHERETHEMFGVAFEDHPGLTPLLLPEGFEGHPLRKDFVLAARVAKAWPGAKEPGESEHGGPKRRTMLPPGVPDPNEWGPLKGQLPPATARPGRAARPAAADRPPRRTRSASEGSAAQRPQTGPPEPSGAGTSTPGGPGGGASASGASASGSVPGASTSGGPGSRPSASGASPSGTASGASTSGGPAPASADAASPEAVQPSPATTPSGGAPSGGTPPGSSPAARPRRSRSAADGSASQQQAPEASTPRPPRRSRSASQGSASQRARATDAPWHDAQPAFDDPGAPSEGPGEPSPQPRRPSGAPDASSEPRRRPRGEGPGDEPPAREGAGGEEAPHSGPAPDPAAPRTGPAPTDKATPEPEPDSPDSDNPDKPHPAGGDTE
ncbi:NADH-quinone oxidoreductase subunit C [Streptomyces sp. NPDC007346]|uniref:NADH-quinone oxidoreductase subunit C n=1 Tax=Streptomyces sp. NPDC007346 TaxID=3154682 RepID=UPI003456295A